MNRQTLMTLGCCLLIALPFLVVDIPPITDLPQQTAQIRLVLGSNAESSPYRLQLWHPNKLGYLPLAFGWLVSSPLAAGRLGMMLIGVLWMLSLLLLAKRTERSSTAAVIAALFFFNHLMYWGFVNFLVGLPVFILWWLLVEKLQPSIDRRQGWTLTIGAWLLYSSHVLWLAAGLIWLAWHRFARTRQLKPTLRTLLWTLPVVGLVALWYPTLERGGFDSATHWGHGPLERLHPSWLLNSALGGMYGKVELLVAVAVLLWIGLGVLQNRQRLRQATHPSLLITAAGFAVAALALPGVTQHTIFFASRWLPMAVVFLILGAPSPNLRPPLKTALSVSLLAVLSLATALTWHTFERDELAGLEPAIAALPDHPRVLGLDFVRQSERIRGYPFYHLYAYAQVVHVGELNRSFANEASSLVVYRDLPRQLPWTEGLDWNAKKLRQSDIGHFQFLIVHGEEQLHAIFEADPRLEPVKTSEVSVPWRLYRVHSS